MDNIFLQISAILALTVSIALVMRLLRQPLMVAYIVAGIVAGPLFLNLVDGEQKFFEVLAEFGIVLLLFIIGLSLNLDYLKRLGRSVLIGGLLQFALTTLIGYGLLQWLGLGRLPSLFLSMAVAFSSTIIVVKLLGDKKDSEALYGRFVIGLLLVQDIIAITILIFLNTIGGNGGAWYEILIITVSRGLLLLGVVFLLARYVLPFLIERVAHSGELLFIFTIAWCFGVASLVYWAGFNLEIGAIIAGISLGASPYQPQIASRIRPLRDFFIVLFFIVLGSEIQLGQTAAALPPALVLSAFILIADPLILYGIMRYLGYTRHSAVLAGITAAQVSEFGFILIFKAQSLGYLQGNELTVLTLAALITIVVSSYAITYNEQIYRALLPAFRLLGRDKNREQWPDGAAYEVWVFGYHRIGWKVCEALAARGVSFAVVDFNPEVIAKLKQRGIRGYFGDAADVEFLESLPIVKARLVISTLPEVDDQKTLAAYLRQAGSKAFIIGNLYHSSHLAELYQAGADYVMMPHLLGGEWIAGVLKHKPWSRRTFAVLRQEQKREMKLRLTAAAR